MSYIINVNNDFHTWYSLLKLIRESNDCAFQVLADFSTPEISNKYLAILLHIRDEAVKRNIQISWGDSENDKLRSVFNSINQVDDRHWSNFSENCLFISPVVGTAKQVQNGVKLKEFLLARNPALEYRDISGIDIQFKELYQNIAQHAKTDKGYLFVWLEGINLDQLHMLMSDTGRGLAGVIKDYFKESMTFETDGHAIEYATRLGVSSKTDIKNGGLGLFHVRNFVTNCKGELDIYSHHGVFRTSPSQVQIAQSSFYCQGTFVYLCISLLELDPKTKVSYKDELDF
jgi:anti-sigma regulatory factor (Ser/Thr protein kinase)